MAGGYNPFGTAMGTLGGLTGGLIGQGLTAAANQLGGLGTQTVWYTNAATNYYEVYTTGSSTTNVVTYFGAYPPIQPAQYQVVEYSEAAISPEEAERIQNEYNRTQVRMMEEQQRIEGAAERARLLLERYLSESQLAQWRVACCFEVVSQKNNLYRLRHTGGAKVCRIDQERRDIISYCIHTYDVPPCDELLGFKVMLEIDEDRFLATANATRLR